MNATPFTPSFIGATGQYPIFEYVDSSSNSNYLYSSNNSNYLYGYFATNSSQTSQWINSNVNGVYFNNISTQTRIDNSGILNVYHTSTVLLPEELSSWWNVEDKITSNMIQTNLVKYDVSLVNSMLLAINSLLSTIESQIATLEAGDLALSATMAYIESQIQTINAILDTLNKYVCIAPLERNGDIIKLNYNGEQFNLIDDSNLNIKSITQNIPSNRLTYTEGVLNQIDNTNAYITYIQDGTITFPVSTIVDFLVVGAGGRGGAGFYSGGGGGGEVIYKTSHTFSAGTYNIKIGQDSSITNNRITKIYQNSTDLVVAKGGGDGGYYDVINSSIYNYYVYKSVTAVVNNVNTYTLNEGGHTLIFANGVIVIDNQLDYSSPILYNQVGGIKTPYVWYSFEIPFNYDYGIRAVSFTNQGAVRDTTNYINGSGSASFDGISQYINTTMNISLNAIQSTLGLSISFWTYLKSTSVTQSYIFEFNDGTNRDRYMGFGKNKINLNNYLQFEIKDLNTNASYIRTDGTLNYFNNKWYYITLTFATNGDINFYINTELIGSINYNIPNVVWVNTFLGRGGFNNSDKYFFGMIDDFRIYQSTLTLTEIKTLYTGSIIINQTPVSGGSGGGGSGGDYYQKQSGASSGSVWNATYSSVANGSIGTFTEGGVGGGNGYTEVITGNDLIVGRGGLGNGDTNYYPEEKTEYGAGGDGCGGNGFQGIVIIKAPYEPPQTTFSGYTNWDKINSITTDGTIAVGAGNQLSVVLGSTSGSKWTFNGNNIYNNNIGNVGIGTINPINKLEVLNGSINTTDYKFNNNSIFQYAPANTPSFTNGTQTSINATDYYISFTTNGTLTIPVNMTCDCLVVGAGGKGGTGAYSGGGGAGEVVYYPSLTLLTGIYNIEIGVDSTIVANRISKLKLGTTEIISAQGGGNGGYWDGTSFGAAQRFPSKAYNTLGTETSTTLNGISCYKNTITLTTAGITYGSGTYDIWYSSKDVYSTAPVLFNYTTSEEGAHWRPANYTATTGVLTTQGNNYYFFSDYKGDWVCIKMVVPIAITSFSITQRSSFAWRSPKNFRIYGSMTGDTGSANWTTLATITNASYTSGVYTYTFATSTTPYLYYCLVVNVLTGGNTGSTILNFVEWIINGKQSTLTIPVSGGSGGGAYAFYSQAAAVAGTPFNATYSKLTNGYVGGFSGGVYYGGDGGYATAIGRYDTTITGTTTSYGGGGLGATAISTPTTRTNYGDGGDGNGGNAYQGIIILRFSATYITKFLEYTNWYKLFNINVGDGLKLNTQNNNLISTYWTLNNNNELYNNNIGTKIGIGTSTPLSTLDVVGSIKCEYMSVNASKSLGVYIDVNNLDTTGTAISQVSIINNGFGGTLTYFPTLSGTSPNQFKIENTEGDIYIKAKNASSYIFIKSSTGNVGIGNNNPSYKLDVSGSLNCSSINTGSFTCSSLTSTTITTNNNNVNAGTGTITCGALVMSDEFRPCVNKWHRTTTDNLERFYFGNGSHTYFRTGSEFYFRNSSDENVLQIGTTGYLTCRMEAMNNTGNDFTCVAVNTSTGNTYYERLMIAVGTFTGFHRCFFEDPDFNLTTDDEWLDFKKNYEGRLVISIGKINTHYKTKDMPDWIEMKDKDGIFIEDALPIVQFSRIKKDKRIYGILGDGKRFNSSIKRLVVNGVGEGGIWVINTNGNLENGDLLQSSDEMGYAERQDDDIIRNYTIGKIVMDCNFELDSPYYKCEVIDETRDLRRAFVACVYMCS